MGIYIKGMEMPKGIEMLVVFSDGTVHKCLPGMREYVEKGTAVPLLSHGRLIDADALGQSIKESISECHKWADEVEGGEMYARVSQSLGTFVECSLRVKSAPTIIPAEEGE